MPIEQLTPSHLADAFEPITLSRWAEVRQASGNTLTQLMTEFWQDGENS